MTLADVDAADRAALHKRVLVPLAIASAGYFVAYAVSLFIVESVMGTGPVLSALGIWLAVAAVRAGNRAATLLGLGLGVLSLTLFITVNALGWSPSDARHPFAVVGAVVGGFTIVLALVALLEPRRPRDLQALAALRHTSGHTER
ncbi:MAG: hypothetical protein Q8O67_29610 [Deltaproteobacteria bacterium]|nr:hypothetical protein [Deltaproteobacteria bacterium]